MYAGEPCFLPQQFRTQRPISNPTEYTRLWVSEVAGQFQGGVCEVTNSFLTPHLQMLLLFLSDDQTYAAFLFMIPLLI